MQKIIVGLLVAASLAAATGSHALDKPKPGSEDSRVRFVDYKPYNVVKIVGSLRTSVQVEFAADEEIVDVALGNNVAWEVQARRNIMFLKAREQQPSTNGSVVTTRRDGSTRSYQIEVSSDDGEPYFYVKYRYPADEAAAKAKDRADRNAANGDGAADRKLAADEFGGPRNWAYTARGAEAIEPTRVYDTGKQTVFVFTGNTEIPAIFIKNTDGSESLVPKSVDGDLVRVHAIGSQFILRRGKDVVEVNNEAFDPVGVNPSTRTTSPAVERVVDGRAVRAANDAKNEKPVGPAATPMLQARPVVAGALPPPQVANRQ